MRADLIAGMLQKIPRPSTRPLVASPDKYAVFLKVSVNKLRAIREIAIPPKPKKEFEEL